MSVAPPEASEEPDKFDRDIRVEAGLVIAHGAVMLDTYTACPNPPPESDCTSGEGDGPSLVRSSSAFSGPS